VPELPDVEGFRQVLAAHAAGRLIRRVDVLDTGVLRDVTACHLSGALRGRPFGQLRRHGKWLIAPVDMRVVLLHFGMTGSLYWVDPGHDRHSHDRVVFTFSHRELRYRDMRKLYGLRLARDQRDVRRILTDVGPDANEVSRRQLLTGRRRQVKAALTDQSIIAGIGNLLADEILWWACIHPRRPRIHLGQDELARLDVARDPRPRPRVGCGLRSPPAQPNTTRCSTHPARGCSSIHTPRPTSTTRCSTPTSTTEALPTSCWALRAATPAARTSDTGHLDVTGLWRG
jgi:formamidopyrimidine-DNA glycosylase